MQICLKTYLEICLELCLELCLDTHLKMSLDMLIEHVFDEPLYVSHIPSIKSVKASLINTCKHNALVVYFTRIPFHFEQS